MDEPRTIAEGSHALFGEAHGYNVLLALEEAGAHVEYLYQRGLLEIENLEEVERAIQPLPSVIAACPARRNPVCRGGLDVQLREIRVIRVQHYCSGVRLSTLD